LQFGKFDEIQKRGYEAAKEILQKWEDDDSMPSAYIGEKQSGPSAKTKGRSARRNSI
jgi:lysophospholipid hydrolase